VVESQLVELVHVMDGYQDVGETIIRYLLPIRGSEKWGVVVIWSGTLGSLIEWFLKA
jgi:hypothetical protein